MHHILAIALALGCLVNATPILAQFSDYKPSKLVGKPCPEIPLENYMLQGDLIAQADMYGRVVYIDFYQTGCPSCEKYGMPHAQELFEKYKDNPDVIVMVVNTAFEKDSRPFTADEAKTKDHLVKKGWTMPVARDKDERCIDEVFGQGTTSGLILDPSGVIRYHQVNLGDEKNIERIIEEQIATLKDTDVPAPYSTHVALADTVRLIGEKDYGEALQSAKDVLEWEERALKETDDKQAKDDEGAENFSNRNPKEAAKVVRHARYLISLITNSFKRRCAHWTRLQTYDPPASIPYGETIAETFRGVDPEFDATAGLAGLATMTDEYKAFVALDEEYQNALKQYEKETTIKGGDASKSVALIKDIAERGKGTRIGDDAMAFLKNIGAATDTDAPSDKTNEADDSIPQEETENQHSEK
ncbi:MAG: TlpA family protein disulfide reductase [Planctomycetes bacterium]|nr:TlpA family protein disulfide reductase [Planctomycetota bacterium]NUQ33792.1 TlpA family protein disulfide reductase [Planctomycetaceae bacterium]